MAQDQTAFAIYQTEMQLMNLRQAIMTADKWAALYGTASGYGMPAIMRQWIAQRMQNLIQEQTAAIVGATPPLVTIIPAPTSTP